MEVINVITNENQGATLELSLTAAELNYIYTVGLATIMDQYESEVGEQVDDE